MARRRRTHHTYPNERVVRAFRRSVGQVAGGQRTAAELADGGRDTYLVAYWGAYLRHTGVFSAEPGTAARDGDEKWRRDRSGPARARGWGTCTGEGRCSWRSCRRRVWCWRCCCLPARPRRWARWGATSPGSRPCRSPRTTRSSNHNGTGSAHEHQLFGNSAWLSSTRTRRTTRTWWGGRTTAERCWGCRPRRTRRATGCRRCGTSPGRWRGSWCRRSSSRRTTERRRATSSVRLGRSRRTRGRSGTEVQLDVRAEPGQAIHAGAEHPGLLGSAGGTPGGTLTAHIDFPSCWDGVMPSHPTSQNGDTRDNAHYAYRVGQSCPAGFPIGVTELRETVQFRVRRVRALTWRCRRTLRWARATAGRCTATSGRRGLSRTSTRSSRRASWTTGAFASSGCQP